LRSVCIKRRVVELFGVTGDLAHKMIFPALDALAKRDALKIPVIGVASPKWSLTELHNRVKDSIQRAGGIDDQRALKHLLSRLSYVSGDYNDRETFTKIKKEPGEESPYERLLGDAMAGDGALFTREDAVEAAWTVVEPVLKSHHRARPYRRGRWGPKVANDLIAPDGCWNNPVPADGPCK
jgi:glucose-6-phosphate 1-dehydrogenase